LATRSKSIRVPTNTAAAPKGSAGRLPKAGCALQVNENKTRIKKRPSGRFFFLLNIIANSGKLYRTVSRNFRMIPASDAMFSAKTLIFYKHEDGMKPAALVVAAL
jgi:hypothetical protein